MRSIRRWWQRVTEPTPQEAFLHCRFQAPSLDLTISKFVWNPYCRLHKLILPGGWRIWKKWFKMASKVGQLKPFYLEEKKEGPSQSISDATFTKWQGSILSNIRKEDKWTPFISRTWSHKKEPNRGFTSNTAEADSKQVDLMLAYIAQYALSVLYRDITQRSTSLESVWTVIRQWAGLKSSGCKHYTYYQLK